MIVQFSVGNFRSIKEIQTLNFEATKLDSNVARFPAVDENNVLEESGMRLLKTIGLYGANASGKSNVLEAFKQFAIAVRNPPTPESSLEDLAQPFLFHTENENEESFFQIILIIEGKKYRYGFTVKRNPNPENANESGVIVSSEWLFGQKDSNMRKLFTRKGMTIEGDGFEELKNVPDLKFPHNIFLTHVSSFENGICLKIWDFIRFGIYPDSEKDIIHAMRLTLGLADLEETKKLLLEFLTKFGLYYEDIILEKTADEDSPLRPKRTKVFLVKNGKRLNLRFHESQGTQKLFHYAGLLSLALNGGPKLVIMDEIDSNFHPALVKRLVQVFNDKNINKNHCQLLFSSHDTNLMDPGLMRRDQFYFTEKDVNDATRLYSLSDLKGIRNDADFATQYLAGMYGGIPLLPSFTHPITQPND
jgi:uncharacterized protein